MRVVLLRDGAEVACVQPPPGAQWVRVEGLAACPRCGAAPFSVGGRDLRPSDDDRAWEADAGCADCRAPVGVLRVEVSTLFGVREDEAVLNGRCRVY